MKAIIGVLLVLAGLYAGYSGYQSLSGSSAKAEIGDVEISVQNEESSQEGYLLLGAGIVAVVGGLYLVGRRSS